MAEYIERKVLINQFCERCNEEMSESPCEPSECFAMDIFKAIPSADVAPVKYGRWGKVYRSKVTVTDGYVSTCCDMWNERKSRFCPNCGAIMDGGADNV